MEKDGRMTREEIIAKIKVLYAESLYEKHKDGVHEYEWELGGYIADELLLESMETIAHDHFALIKVLCGYPIRINYENPFIIKLWREVKA